MLSALFFAALAAATPVVKRQAQSGGPSDTQILNYALTLEHLENAFYQLGIKNFTQKQFQQAGTSAVFYQNLKEISSDESTHVSFLEGALGEGNYVQPCTYAFPVTTPRSFLQVASILEGVGVSAYLGAAQYIANPAYLTYAGSVLTVESRHSALLRNVNKASPFPSPFDIPLDFDEVYSLAAQFITSCPSGNAALLPALKAFPAISVSPATPAVAGSTIALTVAKSVVGKAAWFITTTGPVQVASFSGSGTKYSVKVPQGVQAGQEYLVITGDSNKPTDDNIVAGPAIVNIEDNIQSYRKGSAAS